MSEELQLRYEFELDSPESKRVINQTGVRARMPKIEESYGCNACWDGVCAPDGRFYYPPGSESGFGLNTKLAYFDYEKDEVVICLDTDDVLLHPYRKMPHSKFHTSINVIPRSAIYPECPYDEKDYLLVATTHVSDGAPGHPEELDMGYFNHVWEGFPGGQIVVYDPKANRGFSLGTPVPQESLYGAKYDPKHNRLYMIGFTRGHIYCYDFAKNKVIKDLGKVAEIFCFRLVLGADGNIYGCSKSGQLFKIDTDKVEVENMAWHVPVEIEGRPTSKWYQYMVQGRNHPSGKYLYFVVGYYPYMYKLEFATGEVTMVGCGYPKDGLYKGARGTIRAFDFDKDGVIWMSMMTRHGRPFPYRTNVFSYLVRWDPDNGESPYCCGLLGKPERIQSYVTELEYDPVYDRLYWSDQCCGDEPNRPSAGGVDLTQFRKVYRERGPVTDDKRAYLRLMNAKQIARAELQAKGIVLAEENSADNPFQAFEAEKVEAIRVWRSVPRLEVEDSKVIGMAFDKKSKDYRWKLHVVSGSSGDFETAAFVMELVDGVVTKTTRFAEIDEKYKSWLRENILPQPVNFDPAIKLPEVTGRRWLAKASCVVDWNNDRKFVGTKDALAAIVSPNGKVFSLGNAAAYGPVRSMCTNKAKTELWGVAGDQDDLGYVFHFDEETGLNQLGIINYNIPNFSDGPSASNVLSSICLSPDEKYLAIGGADRIAAVHVIALD